MITAVDTNILIDIFSGDPAFHLQSGNALKQCLQEGSVCACEIVWTETATAFQGQTAFTKAMETLNIEFSSMDVSSAISAAQAWRHYRHAGGKRERVAPDFLIGAHALTQCERLLTRDKGFYRTYFSGLTIMSP